MISLNANTKKSRVLKIKQLLTSWLLLMFLTLNSVVIGLLNINNRWMILAVLLIVFLKGQQITDVFMELKSAPKRWRLLLLSYVCILPILIAAIYLF
jgi:cytochrome c oxidase subunit IV